VRVEKSWHYICLFVDLYNREIIGHSAGPNKDAQLVYEALSTLKVDFGKFNYFTQTEATNSRTRPLTKR